MIDEATEAKDEAASATSAVTTDKPTVVVIICCYNSMPYLPDCLGSLNASNDSGLNVKIVAINNASPDGSADYIRENFPDVHLHSLDTNLGFAGGNNAGWQYTLAHFPQADYLVLLNHDTLVESGWLAPLVQSLKAQPDVACVQPKILLHPATDTFNTAGNRSHFLGFGYMTGYGQKDQGQFDTPGLIDFPSGAAVMIRTGVLHKTGLFDDTFFAYLEDADLAWRCRLLGMNCAYEPASVIYHKYVVKAPFSAYFLLERNRWILLLTCYKWRTLLLLLPALLFMELGQCFFAFTQGLIKQRLRVYGWYLKPSHWSNLLGRRRYLQSTRRVTDKTFSQPFSGEIHFEAIDHFLLRRVANPILKTWWSLVRCVLFW